MAANCLGCGAEASHSTEAHVDYDAGAFFWAPVCGPGCVPAARATTRRLLDSVWDAHADQDHSDVCTADDVEGCEGGCVGETRQVADELDGLAREHAADPSNFVEVAA